MKSYFSTVRYERGTFESLDDFSDLGQEWSEELCLYRSDIANCCKGKRKSTGGYHFR